MARGLLGRPDRADRRPRGPDLAGAACRSGRIGRGALRPAREPVRRSALCRIAAPQHRQGAPRRKRPDRSRLCQGPAAGCDQRAVFRHDRRLRGPRRAAVYCRRQTDRRDRSRPAHLGPSLQDPRRDGGAVCRYSGGAGLHRRDRRALFVPADDAQTDSAALHRRRRIRLRCGQRGGGRAEAPGRGGAGPAALGPRPVARHHRRGLPEASGVRDRRHQPHELCGLLPDRVRLHQMGQGP